MRHPFVDPEVVDLMLGMSSAVRAGVGAAPSKPLLRAIAQRKLPENLSRRRPKVHFGDFVRWTLARYAAAVEGLLDGGELRRLGWIDDDALNVSIRRLDNPVALCATIAAELSLRLNSRTAS